MLREVKFIVVHCTQTFFEVDAEIIRDVLRERGRKPIFHGLIDRYGNFVRLIGCNWVLENLPHHNEHCYHLAYVGGLDTKSNPGDTRDPFQNFRLFLKLKEMKDLFPQAKIVGADYFLNNKIENPCFDAPAWFKHYGDNLETFLDELTSLDSGFDPQEFLDDYEKVSQENSQEESETELHQIIVQDDCAEEESEDELWRSAS